MSSYMKSAWVVSLSTLASRITGLARDTSLASVFGAGMVLDAFVLAFTIPNLFRRFFGEGAFAAAFIPVFTDVLEKKGENQAWKLASKATTFLAILLSAWVFVGTILALSIREIFPVSEKTRLALGLTATMMPYLILICITAFFGAVLNSLRHFLAPSIAPMVLNITWLVGIFFVAPLFGATKEAWGYGMAVAIVVGGLFQMLLQIPALRSKKVSLSPNFEFKDPSLSRIFANFWPVVLGSAVFQINVLMDRLIAWVLIPGDGALTVIYMADRLIEFPLALIGISLATVVFPYFTRHAVRGETEKFATLVPQSLRMALYLTLPSSAGLILLGYPVVSLIYEHKSFTAEDAMRTTNVLVIYSVALSFYVLLHIISKAFYSLGDTKTPTRISMAAVGCNFIVNLILVPFWAEVGLALSTAFSAVVHFFILASLLQKKAGLRWQGIGKFLFQTALSVLIMGLVVKSASFGCGSSDSLKGKLFSVSIPVFSGIIVYFSCGACLKMNEFYQMVPARFKREVTRPDL